MVIGIHLTAALFSLMIGGWQMIKPKGSRFHRTLGWVWIVLMMITAVSSFWIPSSFALLGTFGLIHLLSIWVLICLIIAISSARKHKIRLHQRFTLGAYLGLAGAGLAALLPGRMISSWLFGG